MKSMAWGKYWRRDPVILVLVVFGILSFIFPFVFLPLFVGLFFARVTFGWTTDKLDWFMGRYPKLSGVLACVIGLGIVFVMFVVLPSGLLEAWNTGEISGRRRWAHRQIFTVDENPIGYWFTFGMLTLVVLIFFLLACGILYFVWSARNQPRKRFRKFTDPVIPMEPTSDEIAKFRRTVNLEDFKNP
jgi:hypothetical protein